MKIFIDSANIEKIKKLAEIGIIDGVTTNPTHLSKEGGSPTELIKELTQIIPGDISVEVTEKNPEKVYKQAREIANIAQNIAVKIPCHADYYPIIKKLVAEGIQINVTLVFSLMQALYMCKLDVKYISPFIGRLDDNGLDGIELVFHIRHMMDQYKYKTQLIASSIRSTEKFQESILAGADVATVPVEIFKKSLEHPLTEQGMERFLQDWQKLGIKQFP